MDMMFTSAEMTAARKAAASNPFADLSEREISGYSLGREVLRICAGDFEKSTFEREVTTAAYKQRPAEHDYRMRGNRIIVPPQVLARAMATSPGAKGGYLVNVETRSVLDALRPLSVVLSAGAVVVPGLTTSAVFPRQTGSPTMTWQAADGTTTNATDPTYGEASFTPRTAVGVVVGSRQLLTQSPALIDATLMPDLVRTAATTTDAAVIQGAGGAAPLGILNTPGVGTQSGTTLGVVGLLAMQRVVAAANGLATPGGYRYITTPTVAELLSQRATLGTGTQPVWQGPLGLGSVLGVPAFSTANTPTATMVGGDFSRVLIGEFFGGLEIEVSPNYNFNGNQFAIRAMLTIDVAVAHPSAFVVAASIT